MSNRPTLVLGGTGKTGRRVADRLIARGRPVRTGSRTAAIPFDWEARETWPAAVRGVSAAYISYYPDLAAPGATDAIEAFVTLAVREGVERLVLLSGRGEAEAERCEDIVRRAGVPWTIVRASWFSQNFSESYLLEPVLAGEVALPAGAVGEPFVDVEDIADIAASALVDSRHANQLYEVTGPRLWTFAEAVAEIGRTLGRPIRYVEVTPEEYATLLTGAGVPAPFVTLVTYLFAEVLDGRNASIADGVKRALGREPRDFTEYVRATAASGVWS